MVSEDGRYIDDVKGRIGMVKEAFNKRKERQTKCMSKDIKKRMVKSLAWTVGFAGVKPGQ